MGVMIHFECSSCQYKSPVLTVGMGYKDETQVHPYLPCFCPKCTEPGLHPVEEAYWGDNNRPYIREIGESVCPECGSETEIIPDMETSLLLITPHEIFQDGTEINRHFDQLEEACSKDFECFKCHNNTMRMCHDGFWD